MSRRRVTWAATEGVRPAGRPPITPGRYPCAPTRSVGLGGRRVPDGVSVTAAPSHRMGLIGENRVGNATLLRQIGRARCRPQAMLGSPIFARARRGTDHRAHARSRLSGRGSPSRLLRRRGTAQLSRPRRRHPPPPRCGHGNPRRPCPLLAGRQPDPRRRRRRLRRNLSAPTQLGNDLLAAALARSQTAEGLRRTLFR